MATQRYSVTPDPIETLLTWVKSGEIAIPEIQRAFRVECDQSPKPAGLALSGLPGGLSDRMAQPVGSAEGWLHVLGQASLPECLLNGEIPSFDDFLEQRRKLMAQKIKTYFEGL